MTLRRRLIAVLVTLVALGLTSFAVVSYQLYSRIEYSQLNEQLHSASPLLADYLGRNYSPGTYPGAVAGATGVSGAAPATTGGQKSTVTPKDGFGGSFSRGGTPDNLPEGSYVELRNAQGLVLTNSQQKIGCYTSDPHCAAAPKLPVVLTAGRGTGGRTFTDSSDQFRVLVRPLFRPGAPGGATSYQGDLLVTAIPLAEVHRSLHHLVVLDLAVGAAVLVALSAAGLLLIRRGLAPLERMAGTARAIAAGDLTQRAGYADRKSEVGQLGLAFDTMMSRIERAFADQDATEARLRQFLADASHELRTPLTSIRGYAELWQMGAATSGEELRTAMLRIEQHAREMSALVEELLLLARLDQTRPPERVALDLTVLAAESLGDVAVTAPDRRFALDAPESITVVGDAPHLRQAVSNLLVNAIRHTPAGLPIELSLHRGDGVVILTVRDHGPGLSPDGLDKAFDRFWREERSRGGEGSGLGLAIVAAVAAEHGGRAVVTNAPDGGAAFSLRLPAPLSTVEPRPASEAVSF